MLTTAKGLANFSQCPAGMLAERLAFSQLLATDDLAVGSLVAGNVRLTHLHSILVTKKFSSMFYCTTKVPVMAVGCTSQRKK